MEFSSRGYLLSLGGLPDSSQLSEQGKLALLLLVSADSLLEVSYPLWGMPPSPAPPRHEPVQLFQPWSHLAWPLGWGLAAHRASGIAAHCLV